MLRSFIIGAVVLGVGVSGVLAQPQHGREVDTETRVEVEKALAAFVKAHAEKKADAVWELIDERSRSAIANDLRLLQAAVNRLPAANRKLTPAGWAEGDTLDKVLTLDAKGLLAIYLRSEPAASAALDWTKLDGVKSVTVENPTRVIIEVRGAAKHPPRYAVKEGGKWRLVFLP